MPFWPITLLVIAAMSFSPLWPTRAIAQELDAAGIKKMVVGKTVRLQTPIGISLPLIYRQNGVVSGDISGFSVASLFAPKEDGRWWINNNSLCQQWPSWYDGRQFCFKITALSADQIKWLRDDGASGTAVISE